MKIKEIKISIDIFALIDYLKWWRKKRKFRLIPDAPDERDFKYKLKYIGTLPESTNLRNISAFKWRYNQGNLGACGAFSMVEAFRRALQVNNQPDFEPSPLFGYYISRDNKKEDEGISIRNGFKAINKFGLCSEKAWPYFESKFAQLPSDNAFHEAEEHQTIKYERLEQNKESIKDALAKGYFVVFGANVYSGWMSSQTAKTGIIPMPRFCDKLYGGHATCLTDYDASEYVSGLNHWGQEWGNMGTYKIPWDYILSNDCRDFWAIDLTE
jgi:C1A family cysteine protease